jgi:DNA-binding CsgD family transcriptional regulator
MKPAAEKISLSPRELEIVTRAANGDTDFCIASELKISIHTVNTYWRKMFYKTGHNSRTAVIARALVNSVQSRPLSRQLSLSLV